eukprot:TRINITY_DN25230_c0_g1_i1.p2 TRINITY_DN25230_c0_g1~~TRINITY_DN25230_c0_g1_i1.p2  ORF type:complete len:170 (+),score=33.94 TRINITY_DN25230_c0_g1_i1:55-564(+)
MTDAERELEKLRSAQAVLAEQIRDAELRADLERSSPKRTFCGTAVGGGQFYHPTATAEAPRGASWDPSPRRAAHAVAAESPQKFSGRVLLNDAVSPPRDRGSAPASPPRADPSPTQGMEALSPAEYIRSRMGMWGKKGPDAAASPARPTERKGKPHAYEARWVPPPFEG